MTNPLAHSARATCLALNNAASTLGVVRYVAVDTWSAVHWGARQVGEIWELVCLHSGLDPYPLQGLRSYLAQGGDLTLGLQGGIHLLRHRKPPPLFELRTALHANLRIAAKAIPRGELATLPLTDEERIYAGQLPLIRRVSINDFCRWAEQVGLSKTPPWPDRNEQRRRRAAKPAAELLNLEVVNAPLRAMKAVAEGFKQRYQAGGRDTPSRAEVAHFLEERGARPNDKVIAAICKLLRPDSTPHGPRQAALDRRRATRSK